MQMDIPECPVARMAKLTFLHRDLAKIKRIQHINLFSPAIQAQFIKRGISSSVIIGVERMANEEHLKILLQGVRVWNKWRLQNYIIKPDLQQSLLSGAPLNQVFLRGADLRKADLREANLVNANLSEANLSGANLSGAYLCNANFDRAILSHANLHGADLSGTDLRNSDLRGSYLNGTDFSGANLSGLDLRGTDLSGANLSRANLRGTDLRGTDLHGADLRKAYLNRVNLSNANLHGADLSGADIKEAILIGADLGEVSLRGKDLSRVVFYGTNLSGKDLSETILNGANLCNAKLLAARLINANLDGANLTGACLWETQRAGWSIKGVICESAYWDKEAKEKTQYLPKEFERLFAERIKIRLFYKDGISPLEIATLPALIQHLEEMQGCSLRFVSIIESAGGAVVELAIENTDNQSPKEIKHLKAALEAEAQRGITYQQQFLSEKETRRQLEGEVKQLSAFVDKLILRPSILLKKGTINMNDDKGDIIHISGQAGAVGKNAHAHDNTFNQLVNQFNQSIDLSALAKELSELRQAIKDKQDSSPQADIALVKVAEAEIAATEKDTAKVVEHLKSAGKWMMDFASEIGKDVVVVAIRQSMGMP
jgi:uncharacterized protein YjbI with pentapeptide repeats